MATRTKVKLDVIQWDVNDLRNGSLTVKGTLDGIPLLFLIDTGCSISMININYAKKHNVLKHFIEKDAVEHLIDMAGNRVTGSKILRSKNFKLGNRKFEQNFKVMKMNIDYRRKNESYHGIIGHDFFITHKTIINFEDLTLTI